MLEDLAAQGLELRMVLSSLKARGYWNCAGFERKKFYWDALKMQKKEKKQVCCFNVKF